MFDQNLLAELPLWYVAFLLSLTCHEAAHAWAAQLGGDDTAALGGQLTLNPAPHVRREPFGTVLVPVLSLLFGGWMIGWASAPYDPYWQRRHPHRAAWMALAGPAANLVLVILSGAIIHSGIAAGYFAPPERFFFTQIVAAADGETYAGAAKFISILFAENLLLMTFNLIPVPPLDGATAIGLLLPEQTALRMYDFMHQPMMSLAGLLLAWHFFGELFFPVFGFAVRTLYLAF